MTGYVLNQFVWNYNFTTSFPEIKQRNKGRP